jgi:hypothetical protein
LRSRHVQRFELLECCVHGLLGGQVLPCWT